MAGLDGVSLLIALVGAGTLLLLVRRADQASRESDDPRAGGRRPPGRSRRPVAMLRAEPGLVPVAAAADPKAAITAARDPQPDVAVVDYHLKRGDGLLVCRQLQALPEPPRILIYSAFAERGLGLPAAVAGAHAVVDKGVLPHELFERVRTVARGETVLAITPEAMRAGAARLDTEDLASLGLIIDGTPRAEIAE